MAIVTPTDRPVGPQSLCKIEFFGGVIMLSRCLVDFYVVVGAFVIGLSQSLFLFLALLSR